MTLSQVLLSLIAATSLLIEDMRYLPITIIIGVMVIKGNLYSFWRNNRSDSTLHFPVLFPFLRRSALLDVSFVANGALITSAALLYELRPALWSSRHDHQPHSNEISDCYTKQQEQKHCNTYIMPPTNISKTVVANGKNNSKNNRATPFTAISITRRCCCCVYIYNNIMHVCTISLAMQQQQQQRKLCVDNASVGGDAVGRIGDDKDTTRWPFLSFSRPTTATAPSAVLVVVAVTNVVAKVASRDTALWPLMSLVDHWHNC